MNQKTKNDVAQKQDILNSKGWHQLKIGKRIGEGGNGQVYSVISENYPNKEFAIKFLTNSVSEDKQKRRRFISEFINVQLSMLNKSVRLFQLSSLNVKEDVQEDDVLFYLMEKCDKSLAAFQKEPHSPERVINIIAEILDAVEELHNKGIIHRDLKPENILLNENGDVRICDFGIAHFIEPVEMVDTKTKERLGNRYYSAPEQDELGVLAHVTMDIYAIGQIMYFLIVGKPSKGRNNLDFPEPYRCYVEVVDKCIQSDPINRFQKVSEIKAHIKSLVINYPYELNNCQIISLLSSVDDLLIGRALCDSESYIYSTDNLAEINDVFTSCLSLPLQHVPYLRVYWAYMRAGTERSEISVYFEDYSPSDIAVYSENVIGFKDVRCNIEKVWIIRDPTRSRLDNDYVLVKFAPFADEDFYLYKGCRISFTQSENGWFKNKEGKREQIDREKIQRILSPESAGYLMIGTCWSCFASESGEIKLNTMFSSMLKQELELSNTLIFILAQSIR